METLTKEKITQWREKNEKRYPGVFKSNHWLDQILYDCIFELTSTQSSEKRLSDEEHRTCNVQSCRNPVNEGEFMCIIHDQRFHEPEDNILPDNKEYD